MTRLRWVVGLEALLLSAVALAAGEPMVALSLPAVALAVDLVLRPSARPGERLAGLLAATGSLILVGSELFYLADFLQGSEWCRMNTVFKFGIQAWVLVALAVAGGLPELAGWLQERPRRGPRLAFGLLLGAVVAVSLAYVPLGTVARVSERFPGGPPPRLTLDGLAYMQTGVYHWPDDQHPIELRYDYEAIQWLLGHVRGTPVIAEAALGYYREGGMRVSSYTGLPTLLGAHQAEQRPAEMVGERAGLVEQLYGPGELDETMALLRRLRVQYVYLGQLEKIAYGQAARAKFAALVARGDVEVAYTNPGVVIYRVRG